MRDLDIMLLAGDWHMTILSLDNGKNTAVVIYTYVAQLKAFEVND